MDESELEALDKVFCKDRNSPLLVGSVKTNTGHAEACAALMGIVKVLISMETNTIPAHLQYAAPNPNIRGLVEGRLEVVTRNREWHGKYAAVNAIGLTPSFGHVLLKANRKPKTCYSCKLPGIAVVSSGNEQAVAKVLDQVNC